MKLHTRILTCIFLMVLSLSAFSDCGTLPPCVGDPGEVPGGNCCDDVTVPFDGGVSLLLAAGLGIGVRSAYKKRKKVSE
jgi:hypothetical protein